MADLLEETPPELVGDILERGIAMAGGGSMIVGIDKLVSEQTNASLYSRGSDDGSCPQLRTVLENPSLLKKVRVVGGLR